MTNNGLEKGYVWLPKDIQKKPWYRDSFTFALFTHLLLRSNRESAGDGEDIVPKGAHKSSLNQLSVQTGMPMDMLRRAIRRLRDYGEIEVAKTGRDIIIIILDYDKYLQGPERKDQ